MGVFGPVGKTVGVSGGTLGKIAATAAFPMLAPLTLMGGGGDKGTNKSAGGTFPATDPTVQSAGYGGQTSPSTTVGSYGLGQTYGANPSGLAAPYQLGGRARIPGMDVEQQQGREAEQQLANILYAQALGGGPSAAQPMLQGAMEDAMRQQMSMAAAAGPAGYAGALRGAQMAQPAVAAQFGREAAALRAQEQQAAQGMLQTQLGGMRGQDLAAQLGAAGLLDTGAASDLSALMQTANLGMGLGGQELERAQIGAAADVAQQNAAQQAAQLQLDRDKAINELLNQIMIANLGPAEKQSAGQAGMIAGVLGGLGLPGVTSGSAAGFAGKG